MDMHNTYNDQPVAFGEESIPASGFAVRESIRIDNISPASSTGDVSYATHHTEAEKYLEVYDYVGGARFRGFVAKNSGERAMFVFFDHDIVGCDLKSGLMALLELCDIPEFQCSQLIVCLDRQLDASDTNNFNRDLGWVGFEPLTLADWTDSDEIISDRWIFLGMDT